MRRIVVWLASTVTIVVLLFGYHTSTNQASSATAASSASSPATPAASSAPSSSSSSSSGSSSSTRSKSSTSSTSTATKTYTGAVADTRWGPVQVQITVSAGKITKVNILQQPNGNPRDAEINGYALPVLVRDTLSAQSAQIDMVSGATVTSSGYVQSLQSALDQAGK